jgi:hypothetical protein
VFLKLIFLKAAPAAFQIFEGDPSPQLVSTTEKILIVNDPFWC